jgi:hypothetical protein
MDTHDEHGRTLRPTYTAHGRRWADDELWENETQVLVNGELKGKIVEGELIAGLAVDAARFASYLVELEGGAVEGFTAGYLTKAGVAG